MASGEVELRARSSRWYVILALVVIAAVAATEIARSGPRVLLGVVMIAITAGYLVWWLVWYPSVRVSKDDGVTIVNPLRTAHFPWTALIDVSTKYSLTLVSPDHRVSAFAAPAPGRHVVLTATEQDLKALPRATFGAGGAVAIGDLPRSLSGNAALVVRTCWQELVETGQIEPGSARPGAVTEVWHTAIIAIAAALCVSTVGVLALAY